MDAERDNNRVTTLIGRKPDGSIGVVEVDNATGRPLMTIQVVSSVAPSATAPARDNNRVPTAYGVDSSGDPASLLIDNRNGGIWATVTIE